MCDGDGGGDGDGNGDGTALVTAMATATTATAMVAAMAMATTTATATQLRVQWFDVVVYVVQCWRLALVLMAAMATMVCNGWLHQICVRRLCLLWAFSLVDLAFFPDALFLYA
jgi:hypothetical protein